MRNALATGLLNRFSFHFKNPLGTPKSIHKNIKHQYKIPIIRIRIIISLYAPMMPFKIYHFFIPVHKSHQNVFIYCLPIGFNNWRTILCIHSFTEELLLNWLIKMQSGLVWSGVYIQLRIRAFSVRTNQRY